MWTEHTTVFRPDERSGAEIFRKAAGGIAKIETTTDGRKHHSLFKAAAPRSSNLYPATEDLPFPLMVNTPDAPTPISAKPRRGKANGLKPCPQFPFDEDHTFRSKGIFNQFLPA